MIKTSLYPVNNHQQYHAHVYFDAETLEYAKDLCLRVGKIFDLPVGRLHEKPVGPHPKWSCQISFTSQDFEQLVPWLDRERKNLTVLIHGVTGDDIADHTKHVYWLGGAVKLNLSIFGIE